MEALIALLAIVSPWVLLGLHPEAWAWTRAKPRQTITNDRSERSMTHDDIQGWLDRYVAAWRSYDPAAIGDLFSEDAEYRYRPWDDPILGRAEIVRAWVAPSGSESQRDEPTSWEAQYEPYAVEGDRAVAIGWSRYLAQGSTPEKLYHNCYLLAFDGDGRCRTFTEFFVMQK